MSALDKLQREILPIPHPTHVGLTTFDSFGGCLFRSGTDSQQGSQPDTNRPWQRIVGSAATLRSAGAVVRPDVATWGD